MSVKRKVYIVGTHGVPAKYGGFETLADYLCQNLSNDFEITVFCNAKKYPKKNKTYHGVKLEYVNLDASGIQGIFYDVITFCKSLLNADTILYLSPVGSGFITVLSIFSKKNIIVNHGGLNEWEREKLSFFQKRWAKFNHRIASKFSTINIADNELYKLSLKENFNAESMVIRYGGDHVIKTFGNIINLEKKYAFSSEKYAISVSRAQIDNNLHIALEAFTKFTKFKLVLISNWQISDYGIKLKKEYADCPNIILLDAIYNQEELDYLRSNCYLYVHTHSRCGTAPSLVESMSHGNCIVSFDTGTNRETLENNGLYFKNSNELLDALNKIDSTYIEKNKEKNLAIAAQKYTWSNISKLYSEII